MRSRVFPTTSSGLSLVMSMNIWMKKKRGEYLFKETLRLGRAFSFYDANRDLLELSVDVVVKHSSGTEGQKPRIKFEFFESDDASYVPTFDYRYGKDLISLVLDELSFFADMELEERQSVAIAKKVPYQDDYFKAILTIYVRPSQGSAKEPIVEKERNKWAMLGEIAYIKCIAHSGRKPLWDYAAPWYAEMMKKEAMTEEEKYPHPYDLFKD